MSTALPNNARLTELQRAVKACRGSLFLVFVYSCGYNILLLAPSLYLLQIYDRVLSSRSLDTLLMLTLIVAAAVLVDGLLDTFRRASLSRIGFWLEDRLRPSVFAASFDYARKKDAAVAAEACRDLGTLRQFVASPASAVLFDLPWAVIFFAVLFLVHPLLGAIGAAGALLMCGCAVANALLTRAPLNRAQLVEAGASQRLGAALRNVQAIRAMGMVSGASRLVYRDVVTASEAHDSATRRGEALQAISKCTRSLVQVLIMGAAAWLVLHYHLNAGIIFVSSLLLGRGLAPIEGAIGGWKAFGAARQAYARLGEVLSASNPDENAGATPLPRPTGALSVEGVTWVPPGSTSLVLQNVTLRVAAGDCVGVIGPSGAGKSTLARLIMGIAAPTMGRVRLDGADIALWLETGGARHLGYLPQEVELFEGTVKENIARLQKDVDDEEVIRAAKLVGLHEVIMQLPMAYDTQIGEAGLRLSGGQRQCLGVARAFFGSPRLVVLDEPNANLDDDGERALYRAVEQMKALGTTIVVITHRFGILNLTDKIAVMRGGMISAFGTSEEIYEKFFRQLKPQGAPQSAPQGASQGASQGAEAAAAAPAPEAAPASATRASPERLSPASSRSALRKNRRRARKTRADKMKVEKSANPTLGDERPTPTGSEVRLPRATPLRVAPEMTGGRPPGGLMQWV